ncbi:MAG: BrnA antitoxin family protein [Pseudomonadota bacterium]
MSKHREPLTDAEGEAREITADDLVDAVRASDFESYEAACTEALRRAEAREAAEHLLDADLLEHFRAQGPDWTDRINAALRKAAGL